ncbi:arylamine N-acetyltransferase [bacterium AH-315-C08]|nr:arylamine N-acetyltransferase [bacterium AH-315-C08]
MSQYKFDCDAYLQRIGYAGKVIPDQKHLEGLHHAHLHAIPFENFDILSGKGINLELEALFNKLVHNKRGGYCFELNGIFLEALKTFGFEARPLLGRVHITGVPTGRGHQITLVTLQGKKWIVDVGFGGSTPRTPIQLEFDKPFTQNGQRIRLIETQEFGIMLQSQNKDQWQNLYSFDLEYVCPGDIQYGNHFASTHPDSFFTYARVAALPVHNGLFTLYNNTLTSVVSGKEEARELADGQPYIDALKTCFGIESDELCKIFQR